MRRDRSLARAAARGARRGLRHARAATRRQRQEGRRGGEELAKTDVAKAGDVTLTVWDQEVRGGQNAQIKQLNEAFQAKYPNVTIKRVAKSFTDLNKTLKLAVSGPRRRTSWRPTRAARSWASSSRPGLLRPLDAYAKAYGWDDRYSPTLLDLNTLHARRQGRSARATSTASRRWARSSASSTTRTRSRRRRRRSTSSRQRSQQAKAAGRGRRSSSATSTSRPASTSTRRVLAPDSPTSRRCATSCSPSDGASFDTPGVHRRPRRRSQDWVEEGLLHARTSTASATTRRWQQFAKGKGRFTDRRHVDHAPTSRKAMGDKVGFMLMPAQGRERPGLARRREPAVGDHLEVQAPGRRGGLHRLHHRRRTRPRCSRRPDNLPAMQGDAEPVERAVGATSSTAWQKLNDADGLIPYLDYTTPTFYDDISGGHPGAAGRQAGRPTAFTKATCRRDSTKCDASRVSALRRRRVGRAAAGRAAARRLPVPAAGVRGVRAVRAGAAGARGVAVAVQVGRPDAGHVGGLGNYGDRVRPGAALGVRARADPDRLLRGCRWRSGCCWRRHVALGNVAVGAFTNNQPLDRFLTSAAAAGERVWQLPTWDEYRDALKSDIADLKSTGGRAAGRSPAALFIGEFVEGKPWIPPRHRRQRHDRQRQRLPHKGWHRGDGALAAAVSGGCGGVRSVGVGGPWTEVPARDPRATKSPRRGLGSIRAECLSVGLCAGANPVHEGGLCGRSLQPGLQSAASLAGALPPDYTTSAVPAGGGTM